MILLQDNKILMFLLIIKIQINQGKFELKDLRRNQIAHLIPLTKLKRILNILYCLIIVILAVNILKTQFNNNNKLFSRIKSLLNKIKLKIYLRIIIIIF